MKLTKSLHFALAMTLLSLPSFAAEETVKNGSAQDYKEEIGYFQIANRDLGDPRFMLHDDKGNVDFGIGGSVTVRANSIFGGTMSGTSFSPAKVDVPTDYVTPSLGADISDTYIYMKSRLSMGKHKLIAIVRLGITGENSLVCSQAYLSFDGFSLGRIPSFFMDLESGIKTSGFAQDNMVNVTKILFGYKHKFGENLIAGASLERADLNLDHYGDPHTEDSPGVYTNYQGLPDLVLFGKYRFKHGYIQAAALMRKMSYWSFFPPVHFSSDGINSSVFGYGVSLSGNYVPSQLFKLSAQGIYGRGISSYLYDFDKQKMDLGISGKDSRGYTTMAPLPLVAARVSAQFNWNDKFTSGIVFWGRRMLNISKIDCFTDYKSSMAFITNFFWNINEYAYAGIEYGFAYKTVQQYVPGLKDWGMANTLTLSMSYLF